ncbi:ABC transporter ATP-binding protein [Geitlerinema sp. PCC 9228]|uniref:energy-coupling factor ABC transporter ATP-binding protein n=1 Tax=Geitlerinema sp. PCC 9228 TaxID=111611 RepID=UPI001FCDBCF5|nr:ABC transporter ATP-binding protein [Geitlerinema sp. PCC 9228]
MEHVDLQVKPGERLGAIGPNGAGKTTFFLLLCGVMKPTTGDISLFGKPVSVGEFRPDVGLVFQNPNDQLFSASVWDDVAFAPENMGLSPQEVENRVRQALSLTGVESLIHRPPHHLSGGQKRMVAIASILSMQPRLIVYDEPSANLDLRARRRLIRFLQASQETFIVSSHDLELVLEVCDRTILLDEGRVIADGKTKTIMGNRDLMENHGLEVPHSLTHHHEKP